MSTPGTPNFMNTMNMGGGVASAGGKRVTTLVTKIREEISQLVAGLKQATSEFVRMAESAEKTANATTRIKGGVTSTGFIVGGGGMDFGRIGTGLKTIGMGTVAAGVQAVDLDQFAESSMSRARLAFLSGQSPQAVSAMAQRMMNGGIGIDPMDAYRGMLAGASQGLNPALSNYSNVVSGAATVSALLPGVGMQGGMQASAALNQAQNVNRLRMIGIQVRDPGTGLFRGVPAVVDDIWSTINRGKTGGAAISRKDIAFALQPGNSLDMMIKQYFGNDPILAGSVASGLLQKASGGELTTQSLIDTGAVPALAASQAERYAKEFGVTDAYTGKAEAGMIGANAVLGQVADSFRESVNIFGNAVALIAGGKQLAGGAGGAIGTFGASLFTGGGDIIGGALGGLGNLGGAALIANAISGGKGGGPLAALFGRRGGAPVFNEKAMRYQDPKTGRFVPAPAAAAPSGGAKLLGKLVPGLSGILAGVSGFQQGAAGEDLDILGMLGSTALSALLGFAVGGPGGALVAGGATLGGSLLGHMAGSAVRGEGDGEDAPKGTRFNPLEKLTINAAYLKKRDYLIDGKPPKNPYHTGVDFDADVGDPVYAVKDGTVEPTGYSANGFGNQVRIKHSDGYRSTYAHLSKKLVNSGSVKAGQLIGYAGNTGLSSGPHLHFEVWRGSSQSDHVDPIAYITGSAHPSGATPGSVSEDASAETKGLLGELSSGVALLPGLTGAPSPRGEGGEAGSSVTKNYGGVTVNINVPKGTMINEQNLAREIKRVLSEEDIMNKAVSR